MKNESWKSGVFAAQLGQGLLVTSVTPEEFGALDRSAFGRLKRGFNRTEQEWGVIQLTGAL